MPNITIDGKLIECQAGKTIIEVASENGIEVPHFCWHPALSVSGNCRMCLVEIEKMPKLAIACSTLVAEGQVIHINNERVDKAREAIMEFLLINHPLDCPICDEAGQCKLQDYAFSHGKGESRFDEIKNHKDKRVPLGPEVLFDAERCITCSRCIRFSDEIAEDPVLTFINRGDRVTIETFPGKALDNNYSMNVIDICPVGALTSKDFRFKSRVWDMSFNDTICPGCSRGCNVQAGVRNNEILRLEPRINMKVNQYWMCDSGRLQEYSYVNENRVTSPTVNGLNTAIPEAYQKAAEQLKAAAGRIIFVASPFATLEENFIFVKAAKEHFGAKKVYYCEYIHNEFADAKLKTKDRSPNSQGAKLCGAEPISTLELAALIKNKNADAIFTIDDHLFEFENLVQNDAELQNSLRIMQAVVVCASNFTPITDFATVLLPMSAYAEKEGTFVNINSLVQHFEPAVITAGNQRIMGMKMSRLDKFGALNDRWTHGEVRATEEAYNLMLGVAQYFGATKKYKNSEDIFNEITTKINGFQNMEYRKLDEYHGINLGEGNLPKPHGFIYTPHELRPQEML